VGVGGQQQLWASARSREARGHSTQVRAGLPAAATYQQPCYHAATLLHLSCVLCLCCTVQQQTCNIRFVRCLVAGASVLPDSGWPLVLPSPLPRWPGA
jgi:hypothetical protein